MGHCAVRTLTVDGNSSSLSEEDTMDIDQPEDNAEQDDLEEGKVQSGNSDTESDIDDDADSDSDSDSDADQTEDDEDVDLDEDEDEEE